MVAWLPGGARVALVKIIADTSIWIDYLNGVTTAETQRLRLSVRAGDCLIPDLVRYELIRGMRHKRDRRVASQLFDTLDSRTLCGDDAAEAAALRYQTLRSKGLTVRGAIDVLIASYCIDEGLPLLFADRDFQYFVTHFGLRAA